MSVLHEDTARCKRKQMPKYDLWDNGLQIAMQVCRQIGLQARR
jgi:hypothetical protein